MSFYEYPEDPQSSASDHVSVLRGLSEEKWKIFLRYSQTRDFTAGEVIVQALDNDDSVYILAKGSVEVLASHVAQADTCGPKTPGKAR